MPTSTTTICEKRYEGGQMVCDRCGLVWDRDDPDPPECQTNRERAERASCDELAKIREELKT